MIHLDLTGESRNPIGSMADLDMTIVVGFGKAEIRKNGELFFDGEKDSETATCNEDIKTLAHFEAIAIQEPDAVWECVMEAPLWNATWRRTGEGQWTCTESGQGFA